MGGKEIFLRISDSCDLNPQKMRFSVSEEEGGSFRIKRAGKIYVDSRLESHWKLDSIKCKYVITVLFHSFANHILQPQVVNKVNTVDD